MSPEQTSDQTASSHQSGTVVWAAATAREQLAQLIDRSIESVLSVERDDDGWTVALEVVEARRIPETTDILGRYDVQLSSAGEVTGYRRARRYLRGHGDD